MRHCPGFEHIPEAFSVTEQQGVLAELRRVIAAAPLYRPTLPRSGAPFSIEMTNCGPLGWVSDITGYRYSPTHQLTGLPWPSIPILLIGLWRRTSGCAVDPQACLVNIYSAGSRLGSHRDCDEAARDVAIVSLSLSLGDDAIYHIGGLRRSDPRQRLTLRSGDVVILGGMARHAYHGIDRVCPGTSSLLAEGGRINVTLRRVTSPPTC